MNNIIEARSLVTNTPPGENDPIVTDKQKMEWNNFISWLDKKGLKGKPELDKGNVGNKMFEQYLKENPSSVLSKESIPVIRNEYLKLREAGLNNILAGKAFLEGKSGKDADTSKFMRHIVENEKTTNPNYVGQHLTQTPFPSMNIAQKGAPNVKLRVYSSKNVSNL